MADKKLEELKGRTYPDTLEGQLKALEMVLVPVLFPL